MWILPSRFRRFDASSSNRRRVVAALIAILAVAGCAASMLFWATPASAETVVAQQPTSVGTPVAPTQVSTPNPSSTPGPTATNEPPPIIENIFHIIRFPFETMMEAVVQMSNKIILQSYREAGQRFTGALDALVGGPYGLAPDVAAGAATPLFQNLVLPHWRVTLAAGLLLLPVTLVLTAVSALRFGA